MKIDFTGKKAIVCGGSRGIGKASSTRLPNHSRSALLTKRKR